MSSSDSSHNDHAAQHKAYLDGLHLGFNTPDEILIPLIKLATGSDLVRKERIVKGESNEVYEVELTSAHKVILRISRKDRRRFEREQWAMTQCEKAGIPVPNVIYIAALEGADSPSWASVQTKLAGRSIRDIQQSEGISDRRLQSILRKTGEILAIMHGIQTHGFGRIDGEGRAEYETEWDAINPIIENEQLYDLAKEYEIDVRLLEESLTVARERTHEYTDTPRLLHNDLGPDHIFCG
ncbi:MAG: Phosphotransferase enzyme family protein [Microgenomates bacterium OLB22]|nr:MAG: Phosphotransferase enzyme family protein [Microgenomates bacterium OLB22]